MLSGLDSVLIATASILSRHLSYLVNLWASLLCTAHYQSPQFDFSPDTDFLPNSGTTAVK